MELVLRSNGKRHPVRLEQDKHKIYFRSSPFSLKNEIKSMKGSRWNPEERIWTVSNCPRNIFQLRAMIVEPTNENPYEWFERKLVDINPGDRPLKPWQIEMIAKVLTYRFQVLAADMGLGKSLTAIEIMERSGLPNNKMIFVGPQSALQSVEADLVKWDSPIQPRFMTYERFTIDHKTFELPQLVIFDECTGLKNPNSNRAKAAQDVSDRIRAMYGTDGYVVLMSGSPTAKRPSDIWSQAEIAWPGFLREGSLRAFEARYALVEDQEDAEGNRYRVIAGWKDEEVEKLPLRLKGLMTVYRKADLLNLPERIFEVRKHKPTPKINRIAKQLVEMAPNTITALTWLRALSSGFQYKDGVVPGKDGERDMVETACPKDATLREILAEEHTRGRMICFASLQGSIDRVRRICMEEGWDVISIDGRGWNCWTKDGVLKGHDVLKFWADNPRHTVVVGNPASCRFGLTLVEAKTTVYYDQNFSAEHRLQSMDRNYRIGQDEEVRVIDLLHLDVDELILETLKQNRKLELLSIGNLLEYIQ